MKVSYSWLQQYFNDPLPAPRELADVITFHAFELEGIEEVGCYHVLDIDVLPNRASDCLCHRGIAREVATLLNRSIKEDTLRVPPELQLTEVVDFAIQNPEWVNRFSAAVLRGVNIGPSPQWLKTALETIGQKSINNVVDATNYVMLNVGQPLHAFDKNRLQVTGDRAQIRVRVGKSGEKITTLTGEEYEVGEEDLLIVDGNSDEPIGIAGVKGGKKAEVGEDTTDLIIEAANFNYVCVRKTSQRLKLSTDASVRFQNQPSPELTLYALRDVVRLIQDIAGGEFVGVRDWYQKPQGQAVVSVTLDEINSLLGTEMQDGEVEDILKRFDFAYEHADNIFSVTPPWERTDLNSKQDLIEEIGRVYGYQRIEAKQLPEAAHRFRVNKRFYYADKVRDVLKDQGFSEVYTYTLRDRGAIEMANALAADKNCMREDLREGINDSLDLNMRNAPLLGLEKVKVFEIGTVFKKDGEKNHLALGVRFARKFKGQTPDEVATMALNELADALGVRIEAQPKDGIMEVDFDALLEELPDPPRYDFQSTAEGGNVKHSQRKYRPISAYPFVLRDIAVWTPQGTTADVVCAVIEEQGGELLARLDLFDEFTKEGRTSFAFHLVFQSHEKTLTDEEVNAIMERITEALHEKSGFEVR